MAPDLSEADLKALIANPSIEVRAGIAAKVADHFQRQSAILPASGIALDILKVMTKDGAVRVRQALSESIKSSPKIPHEIALALAKDFESVALPVISHSPVLGDEDLVMLVEAGSGPKQVAVARRPAVSSMVAERIAAKGNSESAAALLENPGADILETSFSSILERHGSLELIQLPMARRQALPIGIAGRLAEMATDEIKDQMLRRHPLPDDIREELARASRMRALQSPVASEERTKRIRELAAAGELTPLIILKAACVGDVRFVEDALSALTAFNPETIAALLGDRGWLGLRTVLVAAGIDARYLPAFRVAFEILRDHGAPSPEMRGEHAKRVLQRFVTKSDHLPPDEMREFIELMNSFVRSRMEKPAGAAPVIQSEQKGRRAVH